MKAGLILAACALALAGCKGDAKKDAGAGKAQGEVLPGSASDAMLPLDTVKSQAPLAPKSEGGEGGDAKGAKTKPGEKVSAGASDSGATEPDAPGPSASPLPGDN
ncbi:MAG: hypothetical protein ACKOQM_10445 [Novosphingobium sp.]